MVHDLNADERSAYLKRSVLSSYATNSSTATKDDS